MARSSRRSSIEIVPRTLEDLADDLHELSERSLKRVVYGSLDDIAADATHRMKRVFDRLIEGGPARFTKVVPGSRSSSVVDNAARKTKGGRIASSIKVQKLQSRYLRFALGEDDTRLPDDVGAATQYNFVPNEHALAEYQGVKLTKEGNLPRNALRGLISRSQKRRTRRRRGRRDDRLGATTCTSGRAAGSERRDSGRGRRTTLARTETDLRSSSYSP